MRHRLEARSLLAEPGLELVDEPGVVGLLLRGSNEERVCLAGIAAGRHCTCLEDDRRLAPSLAVAGNARRKI